MQPPLFFPSAACSMAEWRVRRNLATSVPWACACPEQSNSGEGEKQVPCNQHIALLQLSPLLICGNREMFSKM